MYRYRKDVGTPVNLANRFNLAVLNALWTMTTGQRLSFDDPEAMRSVEEMNKYFNRQRSNVFQLVKRCRCSSLIARNSSTGNAIEFLPFLVKFGPFNRNIEKRLEGFEPVNKIVLVMLK